MPAGTGFRVFASPPRVERLTLDSFADLDLVNIADAMYGLGCVDGRIRSVSAPVHRVVGPALTVSVTPGNGLMIRRAILLAQPGDVLVVNAFANAERAVVGGSVVADMIANGIVGLVVDGAVRDVAEIRTQGFAMFARALSSRSGSDPSGKGEVNAPIACGGVVVFPGDIVIADEEGVVVVPRRDAAAVALKSSEIQRIKGSTQALAARQAKARVGRVGGSPEIAAALARGGWLEFEKSWVDEQ